jgi:hypothetical protein
MGSYGASYPSITCDSTLGYFTIVGDGYPESVGWIGAGNTPSGFKRSLSLSNRQYVTIEEFAEAVVSYYYSLKTACQTRNAGIAFGVIAWYLQFWDAS